MRSSYLIVAPPAAPAAPTLLPSESDGAPGGETTISTSPTLVGATIPGATAQLINSGGGIASQSSVDSSGNYVLALPGPLSVGSYTFQVRVVDQYGDVSAASPAQTINVAPPFVTLEHVIDVVKKKKVTQLMVVFSGAVNQSGADSLGIYRLATPGKKGSYTAKNAGVIKLKSATYATETNTVTLVPKKPFALSKPVQLLINGVAPLGLQDAEGRLIDGNHDGQAGGNAIAIISRRGVVLSAVAQARTNAHAQVRAEHVDALLRSGIRVMGRHHARNRG